MTRIQFIQAVNLILKVFDEMPDATPEDIPNIMSTVQIILKQEKKVAINRF